MKLKPKKVLLLLALVGALLGVYYFVKRCPKHVPEVAVINTANYSLEIDSIKLVKKKLLASASPINKVEGAFLSAITKRIFPYWYGTAWDFNGTTQIPQKGKIACGYFVTTTLRDAGYPINRVKMAQCASEEMIRSMTQKKFIFHFSNTNLKKFENELIKKGQGLYVLGLDNHTGFILISNEGNYFIHASGWYPFKVVREKLSESDVVGNSKYKVVGKISADEEFLKKWLIN
jgi:hypothetical protein